MQYNSHARKGKQFGLSGQDYATAQHIRRRSVCMCMCVNVRAQSDSQEGGDESGGMKRP